MKKFLVVGLILIFLLITPAMGAVLKGTVYDFSLSKADNVVIEINSEPLQRTVTEQGKYQFILLPGLYELQAKELSEGTTIAQTSEVVNITEEGVFTVDLILFPELLDEDLIEETEEPEELDQSLFEKSEDPFFFIYRFFWVLVVIGVLWAVNKAAKQHAEKDLPKEKKTETKEELSDDLTDILAILKKHGGRMTQKDLRKKVPLSEAKISLMLVELEKDGKVKKIKKGRGNIIILK